ncbi:MAG: L,D-transpeptidase family protein [Caulobacterales bacterium]|nr:L,D-transpeptidase family protein [Caulobacterales bacterium]
MDRAGRDGGQWRRLLLVAAALASAPLAALAMAQPPASPAAAPQTITPQTATPQTITPPPPAAAVQIPAFSPAEALAAVGVLRAADQQGLQPKAYLPETLPADGQLSGAQQAALADGVLRYAHDVRVGRLEPGDFPELWALRPAPYDPRPELAAALTENRLQPWLDSLPPRYAGYVALKRGLARYREIAAGGGWKAIPDGKPMALGSHDPRVNALRARLAAEDPQVVAVGPAVFDAALQAAVQRAQVRFGLKPDGVVAKSTLDALNQPVGERVLQIIANMERWRWLPQAMPATRVQVNSGAAIVTLFRDGKPLLSMKAVSGKVGDETPMLASAIHSIVINPPWNVPAGIAEKELWPKERAKPGYLAAHGYRVIKVEGSAPRLQQASGDDSSLGRFKFDFDNPFAVYLHDTPAKHGFDLFARQASHGCVRLEKPRALAEALLEGDTKWTPDAIDTQLEGDKTVRVPLPEKVPVFIMYWTAFGGGDGQMHFRSDPYGWDRDLLKLAGVLSSAAKA